MKNIKKDGKIKRVSNEIAAEAVKEGWAYCPNNEWRKYRDKNLPSMNLSTKKKAVKRKKSK